MAHDKLKASTDQERDRKKVPYQRLIMAFCLAFVLVWTPTRLGYQPTFSKEDSLTFSMPSPPDHAKSKTSFDSLWESDAFKKLRLQREQLFPSPAALKPQVDFWIKVFTHYSTSQVLLHDDRYLDVVYGVLDMEKSVVDGKTGWKAVAAAKVRLEDFLKAMGDKWDSPETMTAKEKILADLFKDQPESALFPKRDAWKRVRAQVGQADRVRRGIGYSGKHVAAFRKIFSDKGLPEELVCLPLIESGFNPSVRSHVGAAGMWQFMPATGKRFGLLVGDLVDERLDPERAARAAADLLSHNYRNIGSWPLAITAYNHGLRGMQNAVKAVGSDLIDDIVRDYNGPRFGFSSRNFYVEFLAAMEIYTRFYAYFTGDKAIHWLPPEETTATIVLDHYVKAKTLARHCGMDLKDLRQLNPALRPRIFNGNAFIPRNYRLNIYPKDKERFEIAYAAIPGWLKPANPPSPKLHRVRKNQTLSHIAVRYGTSVRTLMQTNGIRNPGRIMAGQLLKIPEG